MSEGRTMRWMAIAMALALAASPVAAKKKVVPPAPAPVAAPAAATPAMTPGGVLIIQPENIWDLDLSTGGRVRIGLRPDVAPNAVARIKLLTSQHFYDGTIFHRVIEGFMAQGGDPQGTGQGGSKLPDLKAEFNDLPHVRGAVAMARADDKDSANSQFYIVFAPSLKLDHNYTVVGRVLDGMQWVDAIERGEPPANPSRVVRASMESDKVAPPASAAPAAPPGQSAPRLSVAPEVIHPNPPK